MITTAAPTRRPYLTIALLISLVLHLIGVLIYGDWSRVLLARLAHQQPKDEMVATSDVVHIEKRTVPRVAVRRPVPQSPPQPKPQTQPRRIAQVPVERPIPQPTPVPTPARHEVAHVVARAPAQPVVTVTSRPAAATQPARPGQELNQTQLSQLDRQFQRTIAQAQADVTNVKPPKLPPSTVKHYDLVMQGAIADFQTAEATYEVLQSGRAGERDWYYLRVHVIWPDGYGETVDIPWPIYFPEDNDPIAVDRIFHDIPPPPDFQLPHPFALSRIVCVYFRKECQAVIDAEEVNGGYPATN